MFIWRANVVMTMMAMAAYARTVTEYIAGSGCGTVNTIRILKRNPSVQEIATGCIYVVKEVSSFQPKQEKMPVTLQTIASVPPGEGTWNVFRLLSDNDREGSHLNTTYIPYWDIPLPYGLIFDLGKVRSVDRVDLRNGLTKGWASGTKEFEIFLGPADTGPWKSILSGTLTPKVWPDGINTNILQPAPPREEFRIENPARGRFLKYLCLSSYNSLKDTGFPERCSLNYLGVFETLVATPWN